MATKTTTMRAAVHDSYGPPEVLRIEDAPKPAPAGDEVLVRIRATGAHVTAVCKHSFRRCKGSLKSGGVYLPTDGFR